MSALLLAFRYFLQQECNQAIQTFRIENTMMMNFGKHTEKIFCRSRLNAVASRSVLFGRGGQPIASKRNQVCFSSLAVATSTACAAGEGSYRDGIVLVAAMMSGMWVVSSPSPTYNHCQVPCGIFDDPAIVNELIQASITIRKAMVQSDSLHDTTNGTNLLAVNQVVRWIMTKEEHCNKIITTVSEYCLCQRVKRENFKSERDYLEALKIHHIVLQAAMKAKQTMDVAACDALDHAIEDLSKMYTK